MTTTTKIFSDSGAKGANNALAWCVLPSGFALGQHVSDRTDLLVAEDKVITM